MHDPEEPDCRFAVELPAFLRGELEGAEAVRLEAHLRTCASCSAEASVLGDMLSDLESMARGQTPVPEDEPSDLAQRITGLAASTQFGPALQDSAFRGVLGIGLALALLVGVSALRTPPSPVPVAEIAPLREGEVLGAQRAAVRWLLAHQARDGSFPSPNESTVSTMAQTALALHALATVPPAAFADSEGKVDEATLERGVRNAVAFMLSQQGGDGVFGHRPLFAHMAACKALAVVVQRWGGPASFREALARARAFQVDGESLYARHDADRFLFLALTGSPQSLALQWARERQALERSHPQIYKSRLLELIASAGAVQADESQGPARAILSRRISEEPSRGVFPTWVPSAMPSEGALGVALALLALD